MRYRHTPHEACFYGGCRCQGAKLLLELLGTILGTGVTHFGAKCQKGVWHRLALGTVLISLDSRSQWNICEVIVSGIRQPNHARGLFDEAKLDQIAPCALERSRPALLLLRVGYPRPLARPA